MNKRLDIETIEKLYIEYGTPGFVKRHCKGVTNCALKVAKALNDNGFNLDLDLIYGAGMTHDMGRAFDRHWDVAADKLERLGYHDEAKIVRVHMEPGEYSPIEKVHEGDLLNIGDRLVMDGTYVGIDERFAYIMSKAEKFGQMNSERTKRVIANREKMRRFLDEIEKVIGCSIDDLFPEEVKLREERKLKPNDKTVDFVDEGCYFKDIEENYAVAIEGDRALVHGTIVVFRNLDFKSLKLDDALRFGGPGGPILEMIGKAGETVKFSTVIGGRINRNDSIEII